MIQHTIKETKRIEEDKNARVSHMSVNGTTPRPYQIAACVSRRSVYRSAITTAAEEKHHHHTQPFVYFSLSQNDFPSAALVVALNISTWNRTENKLDKLLKKNISWLHFWWCVVVVD